MATAEIEVPREGLPSLADANRDISRPISTPYKRYWLLLGICLVFIAAAGVAWTIQIRDGMGRTGINNPVNWGVYIVTFVFWVGIAHSGTLISAVLYLVRSGWRTTINRTAEAMTIFAVMTAGLFPLIHLGRVWYFYYLVPYPSTRLLWPNFRSPLVWDMFAIGTYFTISLVFWYLGLIPDLAVLRDKFTGIKKRLYGTFALGWTGSVRDWAHYRRLYLYLAGIATPLVLSVHSVVSWDFAMGIVPGWHSTIFAPLFRGGRDLLGNCDGDHDHRPATLGLRAREVHHEISLRQHVQAPAVHVPDRGIRVRHGVLPGLVFRRSDRDGELPVAGYGFLQGPVLDHGLL